MKTTLKSLAVAAMLLLPFGAIAGDYPDNMDNARNNWLQRSTAAGRPGPVTDGDAPDLPDAPSSPVGGVPWLLLGLAACTYGAAKRKKKS